MADPIMKGFAMLYMFLLSAVLLLGLMLLRRKRYSLPVWKTGVIMVLVSGLGILSTQALYFIENGEWGGMSFFGAVLFLPLVMTPMALLMRIPVKDMMDFIAPPGLLMFAVMKTNCFFSGCCGGRILGVSANGTSIVFPSQFAEAATTVCLIAALLYFEHRGSTKAKLYPISMIAYGLLRFVLNWFREPGEAFFLGMQKGTVWSVVTVVAGVLWLLMAQNQELDQRFYQEQVNDTKK